MLAAGEQAAKLGFGIEVGLGLGMTLSNPIAIIGGVMVAVARGYGLLAELARRSFPSP